MRLIGDRFGTDGALIIHQDVRLYAGQIAQGESLRHEIANSYRAWLHVARGIVRLNGKELREGDGAAINSEREMELDTDSHAEVLLFELV